MSRGGRIAYVVTSLLLVALTVLLFGRGAVGLAVSVALCSAFALTLNLCGYTVYAFTFACAAFAFSGISGGREPSVMIIVLVSLALSFTAVWLTTKYEYGLLISDSLGVLLGYIPVYLGIRYIAVHFIEAEKFERVLRLSHYPAMIGAVVGGVLAFFAVPAVRVIKRYREEEN